MRPLFLAAALLGSAHAATLRPYAVVHGGVVRLSDLFASLAPATDTELGPAPAPGQRITIGAPQLAAIARDYQVDWRPASGTEKCVLTRTGQPVGTSALLAVIRPALIAAGAPPEADIALAPYQPPILPDDTHADLSAGQTSYDIVTGRFVTDLIVAAGSEAPTHLRLAGTALAMETAAALTHPLPAGARLAAIDVRTIRIRAQPLAGHAHLSPEQAIGQTLRRPRGAGEPLLEGDVAAPTAVARNSVLRLSLDAGPIALSAAAIALDGGAVGDRIRVQNPSSRAVVQAVVTGENEARVIAGPALTINLASAR